jgi:hypothetical protein
MKVLMTGATGLVGTALTNALVRDGHTVCRMVRRETVSRKADSPAQAAGPRVIDVPWDPEASGGLTFADSQGEIGGADAVVNLAGASIAGNRWTQQGKMVLRSSRVRTTGSLVSALGRLKTVPKVMVSASAIGYYGSRGDEVLTEDSKPGDDFLAKVAVDWEAEAKKAEALGMRVVLARFRSAMDFVDYAGRCDWDHSLCVGKCEREWSGESGGAAAGPQCGVREGTGTGDAPAGPLPRPDVCAAAGAGTRNGGFDAAGKPARRACAARGCWLHVSTLGFAPRFGRRAGGELKLDAI